MPLVQTDTQVYILALLNFFIYLSKIYVLLFFIKLYECIYTMPSVQMLFYYGVTFLFSSFFVVSIFYSESFS